MDIAVDPQGALPLLDHNPNAIVLDLMLPDGNGGVLLETIRARQLSMRVVVTTGLSDHADS